MANLTKMDLKTTIITDSNRLAQIEKDLNDFMQEYSETPFGLPEFLKAAMENCSSQTNRFPAVILTRADGKIIGSATLTIKRRFGIRYAESLLDYWSGADLVMGDDYRQIAVNQILSTVLEKVRCNSVNLCLPIESAYLQNLQHICKSNKLYFIVNLEPSISHGVLSTENTWSEFLKLRGRYFQKDLRAIERKLNSAGKWTLTLVENNIGCNKQTLYNKIMDIEKSSWKEIYRQSRDEIFDETLKLFLDASNLIIEKNPILKRKIWFLKLHDQPIAFSLVFEYKGTAFIAKTSFAEKYRKLSPGIFVNNIAVKDSFDRQEIKKIDFMSSLSLVNTWNPKILPRVKLDIGSRDGINMLKVGRAFRIGRTLRKKVLKIEHPDKTWPFCATAREQLRKVKKMPHSLINA